MNNARAIAGILIALVVGFLIGYMIGFGDAVNVIADKAAKFIDVNESLVREYIFMATGR